MEEPIGKLDRALQQFFSEVAQRHIPAGHHEHHAQGKKIDKVNDHHRKEGAVLNQIGLSLPQHPDRERDMKTPGKADDPEQPTPVRFHIHEKANPAVQNERQNAVDWKEIRR
jgi:hypothetical protein